MAFPLTWPAGILPTSESWIVENASRGGGPGIDGSEQTVSGPGGRVRAKLSFQLFRDEIVRFRAFVTAMRGRAGTVLVGPFNLQDQPQPGAADTGLLEMGLFGPGREGTGEYAGSAIGTLTAPALILDREISFTMSGGRSPVVGNYAGIGPRLHFITSVAEVDGGFTCGIEPGLRADVSAATLISFDQPRCLMKMAVPVDALTFSGSTLTTEVTLDLVEAF
jgi:hypothetical protein